MVNHPSSALPDRRALSFVVTRLRSPHGGFAEGFPATLPRRQNPQMHLFEAMIALFDVTQDLAFQQRAGEFFGLFMADLYDKQQQALGEYFEDDWSRIEPVVVEPGPQAEWAWLLKAFERITGCTTARPQGELLATALRYRDATTGCLVDAGDAAGNITNITRGGCGPRPRSPRRGLHRRSRARRGRRTRRATRWRGGSPPAFINALTDALGVKDIAMPATAEKVWRVANKIA